MGKYATDEAIGMQRGNFKKRRTCQPPPGEVGGSRKVKEFSENRPLRWPRSEWNRQIYTTGAQSIMITTGVYRQGRMRTDHTKLLFELIYCAMGIVDFTFSLTWFVCHWTWFVYKKKAINFHPSISIKPNGIYSYYSGQPQTSSYSQGTYKEGS